MTVTDAATQHTGGTVQDGGYVDVVIIGAGVSGIGAAYRITEKNPGISYVVLERREHIGGTWDLFRYPGIRSDSSIFTLSFPFEPWTRPESVAQGPYIREYLTDTAHKHGIDQHIRFNSYVRSADWDSATDTWTITTERGGTNNTPGTQRTAYRSRFVFFASGYYNYDDPYSPEFPGIETFGGTVAHPQHWPEDLDYAGKHVVVIGSGATAMSMIPAMAKTAGKVTMLQRTPSYLVSLAMYSKFDNVIRKVLPGRLGHLAMRVRYSLLEAVIWFVARKTPGLAKWYLRREAVNSLPPGYDVDVHFKPPYNPWDQRLCLIPDHDMYAAIRAGRVDVVTDHIDHIDTAGIALKSGKHLDADIIATATGLQLLGLGGVHITVDGAEIKPHDRFAYKAYMLDNVPNLFWCLGYTNASWTLRADMTARAAARLIAHMRARGQTHAYPHHGDEPMAEQSVWNLQAGYVLRSPQALPRSGVKRPWKVRHNYLADSIDYHFHPIDESMVFGRVAEKASRAG
ncbi:MAG TPA: NAD(P)/FAD-dependent oxidoreductase [Mycobacterium sp.]|nr:NAD(P)/FAD-dependent oxidoreductase [Mycobacterium sp.]